MKYIQRTAQHKMKEAQGWTLLYDILTEANLTEEQWLCVNLALGFPVTDDKAALVEEEG